MDTVRRLFWPLLILAVVGLVNCGLLVTTFWNPAWSLLQRPTAAALTTRWSSLPVPVSVHPKWTSFTSAAEINDLTSSGEVVWAATNGGVVVWERTADEPRMVKFTTEHGLPSNQTTAVVVDSEGNVWVGTAANGIGRYDGASWTTYTTAAGLRSNTIQDITIDLDDTILVATPQGINRYSPSDQSWESIPRSFLGLEAHNVRALQPSPEGVWTATERGVERFDGRQWELFTTANGLPDNDVHDVTRTADGLIWAATAAGLAMYDGRNWNTFAHITSLNPRDVHSLAAAGEGLWLGYGDGSAGVSYFALQGGSAVVTNTLSAKGQLLQDVGRVVVDGDGLVWVGTAGGLFVHQPAAVEADQAWQAVTAPSELPAVAVTDLQVGQSGLWGRTPRGLTRFDGLQWAALDTAAGLRGVPQALASDPAGQMWVAYNSLNDGFNRLAAANSDWLTERCSNTVGGHVFSSSVVALRFTNNGTGWVVAHDGVFRLTVGEKQLTCEFFSHSAFKQPRDAAVAGNTLWILTARDVWQVDRAGLHLAEAWRSQGGQFKALTAAPDEAPWLVSDRFLSRFDGRVWQDFPLDRQVVQGSVRDLAVASDLTLWLATDAGVAFYDGRWQMLTTADGLASNDVSEVVLAPDGAVWFVTAGGLSRYYP